MFDLKRFLYKRSRTLQQWMQDNNLSTQREVDLALEKDDLVASNIDKEEIKHLLKPLIIVIPKNEAEFILIPCVEPVSVEDTTEKKKKLSKKQNTIDDIKEED